MGRIFLDHINGTKLYACAGCDTNLTNKSELISTRFTGATGKQNTFEKLFWSYFFFGASEKQKQFWMMLSTSALMLDVKQNMKSLAKYCNQFRSLNIV